MADKQSRADQALKMLSDLVVETIEEMHPECVPESLVYMAFQQRGIPMNVFQAVLGMALKSGKIKKGSMPHSLVKA